MFSAEENEVEIILTKSCDYVIRQMEKSSIPHNLQTEAVDQQIKTIFMLDFHNSRISLILHLDGPLTQYFY
ncbi:hypothetical protein [Oceanobacillus halotolerans]|uniref:hypothetical protein n=1 Tax=Oceanobacillus halotolerans TaxID=2663380 RepID=UPI0013DC095F|nr:hypothetical protein [Oceanobacillus halotolerans]